MKISTLKYFGIVLLALLMSSSGMKACDLSDLTFLGITGSGPYVISVRLCVGMGKTGAVLGGDQSTRTFMFAFWDSNPGLVITGFTPLTVTGPPTVMSTPTCPANAPGCTNNGAITTFPAFGSSTNMVKYSQGSSLQGCSASKPYGCITTTCGCGPAQAYCNIHTITVNQVPDSMRATAIEGAGNNIAGCYPNADMLIDFNLVFSVIWGDVSADRSTAGVHVKWSTMEESNADYFIVERATDGVSFEEIGQVPAIGTSHAKVDYAFFDNAPTAGQNRYRLVNVDKSGGSTDSETIEVDYFKPEGMAWGAVGPNPASDYLDISFYSPQASQVTYQVFDAAGKRVLAADMDAIAGGNSARIDLSGLLRGSYFLAVQNGKDKLTRKIVKL
jgi:Secretion system C-terminal sorting domain